jgi:purine-binding chemotaxis protein CheW
MVEGAAGTRKALIVELKSCICALPLAHVFEIMRPLPTESLVGLPSFVTGVAIIRGIPTPVVDLGAILGMPNEAPKRFVTLRFGDRQVALSVAAVLGVREFDTIVAIQELPPLLQGASKEVIQTIGILDERVLMVLKSGWELPAEVWQSLAVQETVS